MCGDDLGRMTSSGVHEKWFDRSANFGRKVGRVCKCAMNISVRDEGKKVTSVRNNFFGQECEIAIFPLHSDPGGELIRRNAVDRYLTPRGNEMVAMLTKHERGDIGSTNPERVSNFSTEADRVGIRTSANDKVTVNHSRKNLDTEFDRV